MKHIVVQRSRSGPLLSGDGDAAGSVWGRTGVVQQRRKRSPKEGIARTAVVECCLARQPASDRPVREHTRPAGMGIAR